MGSEEPTEAEGASERFSVFHRRPHSAITRHVPSRPDRSQLELMLCLNMKNRSGNTVNVRCSDLFFQV